MTPETVLMYATLITAVLQNINIDTLTTTLDYGGFLQSLALAEALASALLIWLQTTSGRSCKELHLRKCQQHEAAWNGFICTIPVVLIFILLNNCIFNLGLTSATIQSVAILVQCTLHAYLPLWCPRTFTFGEVAILTQAAAQYLGSTICNILQKTALLCCILVVMLTFIVPWCRTVFGFYVTFTFIMGSVAVPLLHLLLGDNFIHWTIHYVTENTWKKKLFIYWLECCTVGVLIVLIGSGAITDLLQAFLSITRTRTKFSPCAAQKSALAPPPAASHILRTNSSKKISQSSTRIRKLFHLLAVAIFVPGAMKEPTMTCVAGTCCLIVFIMMETMRLSQIPPLFQPLQQTFVLFLDDQDQGPVILTHVYLLVGCVLPMWLYPIESVAAVVGSMIGKHHWRGSRRTKEGTIAGMISQLLFIILLYSWGAFVTPDSWFRVIISVILTSLIEAYTSHVDNLILPLVMYILLI
ncbi:hypothetical protein LSH36_368g01013 [Paralvinella palmiformis]|uniref:dolichol kinase n=1 Tax=Paralvinella palmiformis TaxID=53620 RepID=A0AAD9N181_9ANNE|nr:hypothetical protein LSH36_368g01013 [Paralvinella palmiformis]